MGREKASSGGRPRTRIVVSVASSLLMLAIGAGCGSQSSSSTTPSSAANSAPASSHAKALSKRPDGKVGSYDVIATIDWRTDRGTADFHLDSQHCVLHPFSGEMRASGKQELRAFIADQNGGCFTEPSRASWKVTIAGRSRIVSVTQVGPGLYLAGCGSGFAFDCESGPPLHSPDLRIT